MEVRFDENGLVPVVVEEAGGGVLMLAYANDEAVEETRRTGYAHFYSRSRKTLWKKGETSGNTLRVREIRVDCDGDALLYVVEPDGPACHTGKRSCFYRTLEGAEDDRPAPILAELEAVLRSRRDEGPPPGRKSYTARLFEEPVAKTHEKVGEEAFEVVLASEKVASGGGEAARKELAWEVADLWFHTMLLLVRHGVPLSAVLGELERRRR